LRLNEEILLVKAKQIFTLNPKNRLATFLIIDNGEIKFAGSDDEQGEAVIRKLDPEKERKYLSFNDAIICPGFIDSHNHLLLAGLSDLYSVNLSFLFEKPPSIEDIITRISEFAQITELPWVLGNGLNESRIKERRLPTVKDLDKVSTSKPICITHNTVHYLMCDQKALEISDIKKSTPDPPGGKIGRFSNGEPNGLLYERSAIDLVRKHIPSFTRGQYIRAIKEISRKYLTEGITCVKDTGGTGEDVDELQRIQALNDLSMSAGTNELMVRQSICLPVFSLEDVRRKLATSELLKENEYFRFIGFKLFLDGSGFGRTAWMREEWNRNFDEKDNGNFGFPVWNIDEFRAALKLLCENISSKQKIISIHAVGDKAIEVVLEIIRGLRTRFPKQEFTLIHAYGPDGNQLRLIKELNVYVEFQSSFLYFYGNLLAKNLGPNRVRGFMPARSYLKSEITASCGSDSPVVPYSPIYGIYSMMSRETRDKGPDSEIFNESEEIGFEEALSMYTRQSAICAKRKEEIGTLEVGKRADFVVLKESLLEISEKKLEGNIIATFLGGKQVYP
jgi:predicted amidohydrolase YtcJ